MNTRNKKCLCGSGKKSKNCCESVTKKAERRESERLSRIAAYEERERLRNEQMKARPNSHGHLFRKSPMLMMSVMAAMMHSSSNYKK